MVLHQRGRMRMLYKLSIISFSFAHIMCIRSAHARALFPDTRFVLWFPRHFIGHIRAIALGTCMIACRFEGAGDERNSEIAVLILEHAHLDIQRPSAQRNRSADARISRRLMHRMIPHMCSGEHVRSHSQGNSLRGKPEQASRVSHQSPHAGRRNAHSLASRTLVQRGERLAGAL